MLLNQIAIDCLDWPMVASGMFYFMFKTLFHPIVVGLRPHRHPKKIFFPNVDVWNKFVA